MIPAPFEYQAASSLDDAIERLRLHGRDAKLLAGGQSLLPLMRLRIARPAILIDIGRVEDLSFIREEADRINIGPLTRHSDLARSPVLRARCPILPYAASLIGDPQVRHRGTIGGALGHADPASDLAAVLVALGAEVLVRGAGSERAVPISGLFADRFRTTLGPDEIIAAIGVPAMGSPDAWSYERAAVRPQGTLVAVAVVLRGANGRSGDVAISLANMGPAPLRARSAERMILEGGLTVIPEAAEASSEGTAPISDADASADYRRHLAAVLTRRALLRAASRLPAR